ncbi:MAG: DJ-1/PfpI family protein [Methanocellales archaeon]|nr:DJ-1/PfpI family protein [Methanocellales archaeon]MDD5447417.1 DJ-1/PfpI family protein [Methanocellales archaeon]
MMRRILMVISPKNFRDEELLESKDVLKKAGFEVVVTSVTSETCIGMFGIMVKPDRVIDELNVEEFDAVVVVGGAGTPVLNQYDKVLKILREANEQKKILAAICLGPIVLAKAGVLEGKKATVFPSGVSKIESGGAQYVSKSVVIDGNLITADGPQSAKMFGNAIVSALA